MKKYSAILVALLILLFFIRSFISLRFKSATFDEPVHLTSGYSYLKFSDYRLNREHPPLMKKLNALPLLLFDLTPPNIYENQWSAAEKFIFYNKVDADILISYGRIPTVLVTCLLGFFIYLWARNLYGIKCGLFALFLCTFCPNILAHSQLITTDVIATCFIFITIYFFYKYVINQNKRNLIYCGISLGLALAGKFTTVILFPIFVLIFLYLKLTRFKQKQKISTLNFVFDLLLMTIIGAIVVLATYGFQGFEDYMFGFKRIFLEATKFGHESYMFGTHSNSGWRHYYIVAFLLKTPIPVILFFIWRLLTKREKTDFFFLIPILVIFIAASVSKKQLGIRYILPMYPFMYVLISNIINQRKFLIPLLLLCSWYIYSSFEIHPHYLSYFNELAGKPENGWRFLANSNIDWGQDLKSLAEYIKREKIDSVILSYYGTTPPQYYNIKYQDLTVASMTPRRGKINTLYPQKEILAISVNNLLSLYFYDKKTFNWLRDKKPNKKIGYSIFIYDITTDIKSHEYLAQLYFNSAWYDEAKRECERLLILDKANPVANLILSLINSKEKNYEKSLKHYKEFLKKSNGFKLKNISLLSYWSRDIKTAKPIDLQDSYLGIFNLASWFFNKEKYQEAKSLYEVLIRTYPDSTTGYNNLGVIYERLGNYSKAIEFYKQAINLDPRMEDARLNLAILYSKINKSDLAEKELKELLTINPQNQQAIRYLQIIKK